MATDPDILGAWVRAWAIARGVARPVAAHGGFCVEVGLPDQVRRYVFPALGDGVMAVAASVSTPFVFLKVCAPAAAVRAVVPARWVIQSPRFLMMIEGEMEGAGAVPDVYRLVVEDGWPVAAVRVLTADGTEAARGAVVLSEGIAVYDRIETAPEHRRLGLGRAVMRGLETVARGHGLGRGVLVATQAGRGLYEALGWGVRSDYTSAVIET